MAQVQAVWSKFNSRERMIVAGAGLVLLAWIIGARGFGVGSFGFIAAIAVVVVLYLKYANPTINWPVAVPLITLAISGVVAIFAVLSLIDWLGYLDLLTVSAILALVIYVAGTLLMAWGAWQEYQVEKPALPNFSAATAAPSTRPAMPGSTPTAPAATEPTPTATPSAGTDDTASR